LLCRHRRPAASVPGVERDPLDRPATPEMLRQLAGLGALSPEAAARALELASGSPPPALWVSYLRRALLLVGATLLLAGVVFFFAYNWADLGRFEKLGLISAAIVATAVTGWQRGASVVGQVSLLAASVLVGALLAVYGQAYQTGADPFELFTAWMLLILPWTVAGRTPAFFTLQLLLANVALSLFWGQVLDHHDDWVLELLLAMVLLNGAALAAYEGFARRVPGAPHWFTRLTGTVCFSLLLGPTVRVALGEVPAGRALLSIAALVVALATVSAVFGRGPRRDLYLIAVGWASALVPLDTALGRAMLEVWSLEASGVFLLGFMVIAQVGGLVMALRWLGRADVAPAVTA